MNSNVILPNNSLSDVEPVEILVALHKRIVLAEQRFISASNQLSNIIIEITMLKERMEKIEQKLIESDKRDLDGH